MHADYLTLIREFGPLFLMFVIMPGTAVVLLLMLITLVCKDLYHWAMKRFDRSVDDYIPSGLSMSDSHPSISS